MTREEYNDILQLAKNRQNWTPELYKQYQQACFEMAPCIFDALRKVLPELEYKVFDLAYCEYIRPGQKGVVKYLEELRKKEAAEQWEQKQMKRSSCKSSLKSNFLIISKELGFHLENTV